MGATRVDSRNVIWAEPQPPSTLAQKAEIIALIKALELGAGKKINIYVDSRHICATARIHVAVYQERTAHIRGKEIKNQVGKFGSLGCPDEAGNCGYYSLPRISEGKRFSGPG